VDEVKEGRRNYEKQW